MNSLRRKIREPCTPDATAGIPVTRYANRTLGVPEYDKALTYFTFGAANGLYESIYKLADMYRNGYGVIKSPETAFYLVPMLFNELSGKFVKQWEEDQALPLEKYRKIEKKV